MMLSSVVYHARILYYQARDGNTSIYKNALELKYTSFTGSSTQNSVNNGKRGYLQLLYTQISRLFVPL